MKSNILNKVTICSNKKFRNLIIEAANIKDEKTVAVAYWETPALYYDIKERYPEKDVYYIEVEANKGLYGDIENSIYVRTEEEFPNMHFDKVIMNPPFGTRYNPYLHNKIYIAACKCSEKVVCLMPVGKLQTPRKIDSDELNSTKAVTTNLEIISNYEAMKAFGTGQAENLGIYTYIANTKSAVDWESVAFKNSSKLKNIYKKVSAKGLRTLLDTKNKLPYKYSIKVSQNHGHVGNKDEYDIISPQKEVLYSKEQSSQSVFFNFDTEIEAENFRLSLMTTFMKYLRYIERNSIHIYLKEYPFMEDYTQPWTNERFCNYFGITGFISDTEAEPGSEWEEILNTMKDYM